MKKQLFLATAALCFGLMATESASAQNDAIVVEEESVSVVDVTNCKTNYAVNGHDNWFIQLGAGISVPMFENELTAGDPKRHITATYNLGVGRWFSPYLGFRFSGYYGAWHWDNVSYSKARFANLNFDFMWDMCNSLGGVNPGRPVSVIPFVGVGGTYVWDIQSAGSNVYRPGQSARRTWALPVSAGIRCRFRLCQYVDFFLEGRASFYGDNVNQAAIDDPIDINIQAIGGLSFNLGGVNYQAYNACKDQAYIASLNNQVNAPAESQLPCPEVQQPDCPEAVAASPMMSTVRFTINSAKISNEEMVNVYNTAEYLKANPDVKVLIKGYADKDTGTAAYTQKLSGGDRLSYDAEGSSQQPYDVNNWNRIVIFVPGN